MVVLGINVYCAVDLGSFDMVLHVVGLDVHCCWVGVGLVLGFGA